MTRQPKQVAYEKFHAWELYSHHLRVDYQQSLDEGKEVAQYKPLIDAIAELPLGDLREGLADHLYEAMREAPQREGYIYEEPSDLEAIRTLRPAERPEISPGQLQKDDALRNKMYGAWLGRICGCLLGKPVEGWRTPDLKVLLEGTGNYPLQRYISKDSAILASLKQDEDRYWIENVKGYAPADDDTNYTVLAANIIEKYGRDFTPDDVAEAWLDSQPKSAYCTAERVAFLNFLVGLQPPESALYKNSYREWIGAQIRGDYFGYINPGAPELAAEMAWRDASISHVKNGIYGEMFVAAMIAAAAVSDDIKTVIRAGLSEIPVKSRLAEDINNVIKYYDAGLSAADCIAKIHEQYDEFEVHHWCHTNSNAMIVAAALLYGEKDYGKSICMAVEAGFDTDCNGATVGSVVGLMIGGDAIPAQWSDPINGTLETLINGMNKVSISDMVELTMKHIEL